MARPRKTPEAQHGLTVDKVIIDEAASIPEKPKDPRLILIVNEDKKARGAFTKIYDLAGNDISKDLAVQAIDLHLSVDGLTTAVLHTLAINGRVSALVTEIKETIVPPPFPKEQIRMLVGAPFRRGIFGRKRSAYRIERHTPVVDFGEPPSNLPSAPPGHGGAFIKTLAEGWMVPIGPLKFTVDA